MAVKEIGTRFKLEGVQKFKQEMNNCAAAVKVLNSEEKLAEAQFKATGNSEAYAAEKTRILKEQMKQQQAAVEAAEKAIKDLTDQGMEPNNRIMQQWQIRLSNAKTNLSNMQTKLNAVEKEFGEQKTAVKDTKDETEKYNDEMGKVAQGVNLQNTITAIDNLKGHIEDITKKAVQAAKAVWDMGADAGKWADDVATAAAQAGVDAETWQSWQYASRFIDTSVQDILKNQQDIDKKFKEGEESSKTYAEAMRAVGVATHDAGGQLRGSREMFWDAIDALHNISDADEQARKATLLFGNDWRTLQPLIQAGSKAYQDMAQQGRDVAVVSNEQVAALGSVDDAVQDMNARFDKLKYESLAAMAPTFQTVAEAMSTATTALNEFISSEEGQKALEGLNGALSGIIKSFLGEDNGKDTFESIVTGAKDAVTKLTDALDWISQHGEVVSGIITGMGAAWAGLTVTKEVLLFMQLLKATPLSKLGALFGGGAAKAGADAASAAAPAVAAGAKAFLPAAMKVLGPVAAFAYGMKPAATADDDLDVMYDANGNPTRAFKEHRALEGKLNGQLMVLPGSESEEQRAERQKKNLEELKQKADDAKTAARELFQELSGKYGVGQNGATGEWELVNSDNSQEAKDGIALLNQLYEAAEKAEKNYKSAALRAGDGMAEGLTEKEGEVQTAAQGLADAGTEAVKNAWDEHSPSRVFSDLGAMASVGLANGINSRAGDAVRAAQALADRVTAIMRSALQIHSPSAVFEEMGAFTGQGFALGIERSIVDVNRAAGRMVGAVSGAARITPAGYSGGGWSVSSPAGRAGLSGAAGAFPEKVQVTVMVDKDVLAETTVPLVDAKMGARLNAVRR